MRTRWLKRVQLFLLGALLSGCTLATVRTIEADRQAKEGFNAPRYVAGIWDTEFIPTLEENAVEITELLRDLQANEDAATEQYGNRTSTGAFSLAQH